MSTIKWNPSFPAYPQPTFTTRPFIVLLPVSFIRLDYLQSQNFPWDSQTCYFLSALYYSQCMENYLWNVLYALFQLKMLKYCLLYETAQVQPYRHCICGFFSPPSFVSPSLMSRSLLMLLVWNALEGQDLCYSLCMPRRTYTVCCTKQGPLWKMNSYSNG